MKNYIYNRAMANKFSIKGTLTDDCERIEFVNSDKEDDVIEVSKILALFAGKDIALTISEKMDRDLSDELRGDDGEE